MILQERTVRFGEILSYPTQRSIKNIGFVIGVLGSKVRLNLYLSVVPRSPESNICFRTYKTNYTFIQASKYDPVVLLLKHRQEIYTKNKVVTTI